MAGKQRGWREALASYQLARDRYAQLQEADPKDEDARYGVAVISNNLGNLYRTKGQTTEAVDAFGKGRDLLEELVRGNPASRQFRGALGANYTNLALLRVD